MAEIKLKKREEMDPAYCWDLSSLFGSDEEFEKTEQELAKKIEAFRAKQGTMKAVSYTHLTLPTNSRV